MPQINRIRVNNVKYNFGTQVYDDFMMRPNCSSMIYDLANGGGKSLLMLMLLQNVIPNCTLDEKQPVEKLFRQGGGNTVIHSLIEWRLEPCYRKDNYKYMTTGFCARKARASGGASKEEEGFSASSGIEYFNYVIFYREFGDNDIKNLPLTSNGERITYNGLKEYLRNLEKNDFSVSVRIFDRKGDYQNFLTQYGIFESQWEIIRGINKTEGHVRTYFETNYRTSRKVVEDLLIEEIIQKSFNNRLGVDDDEGKMAQTLLDIKDKLLELSKKHAQIGNYDRQVEAVKGFAEYAASFEDNFRQKQELENQLYSLLVECKRAVVSNEDEAERCAGLLEKMQQELDSEQCAIQAAQIAAEEKSLAGVRELVASGNARLESSDRLYAQKREQLKLMESANDCADYVRYENSLAQLKETVDNRMLSHRNITSRLHDIAVKLYESTEAQKKNFEDQCSIFESRVTQCTAALEAAQTRHREFLKKQAAAESLVKFSGKEIEGDERQLADLMEKCGLLVAENAGAEADKLTEELELRKQDILRCEREYDELSAQSAKVQAELTGIAVRRDFAESELERAAKKQKIAEEYREQLENLAKIYNDGNLEHLDTRIGSFYENVSRELDETEKEASRLTEFIDNASAGTYKCSGAYRDKLRDYLKARYKEDVVEGHEWFAALNAGQKRDVLKRAPFIEYSFIIKNDFERIKEDTALMNFERGAYAVPIVSEQVLYDTKLEVNKELVAFAMKDMGFLRDETRLKSELDAAREELEGLNHRLNKLRDRKQVVWGDYLCVLRQYAASDLEELSDLKNLKKSLSECEEDEKRLKMQSEQLRLSAEKSGEMLEQSKAQYTQDCGRLELLHLVAGQSRRLSEKYEKRGEAAREASEAEQSASAAKEEAERYAGELRQAKDMLALAREKFEKITRDWEENYRRFYEMEPENNTEAEVNDSDLSELTTGQLESRFFGLREILDKETVDVADKEALMQHCRVSMEKCRRSVEYRGSDFSQVMRKLSEGEVKESAAAELMEIKNLLVKIENETRAQREELDAQNALMNRLEGSIAHGIHQIEERFGAYTPVQCENPELFEKQHRELVGKLRSNMKDVKKRQAEQSKKLKNLYLCERDLERIVTEAGMAVPDKNVLRQESAGELKTDAELSSYEAVSKEYAKCMKLMERRREDFLKQKQKLAEHLVRLNASELAAQISQSAAAPGNIDEARTLSEALLRTNEYIILEKDRISKGIEDMEQIKRNFESRCVQTCCNIKTELDRLPKLSTITMDDEIISMIGLQIPYVKEEFYGDRMSSYIDETVTMAESFESAEERLKYIRNRLTWKRMFSVIVTDMNAVRVQLYKRERIKDQSRYLRYEEAVGSTGQSQGIYIQFLIAVINYIASINASADETEVIGKTIFIDNPFGAAKDIYIWEPIFKLLKTNHVQLIVPARGATPAITGRFDVNYILGQKLVDNRQQTVVVDYYSKTDTSQLEYTRMDYEQASFDFFE